jgi:outer membrane murein-binding lipoprotein Lpp
MGLQLFYGTPPGGEALMRHVFGRIMSNWAFWVCGEPNLALSLGGSLWQYMATDPRFGPGWDWRTFNFDTDPFKLRPELAEKLNAIDPDLRAFKERGGKIIMWHGWADQLVTPYQSIAYYESVMKFMGENSTKEFFKLYMVPGLTHVGSIGCSDVDWFSALVNWVENDIEPGILIGSRKADAELNLTARTRPIPPYPMVARYIGNGSIDDAKNFVCVNLIPAEVRIEPKIISLDKGNFTAFVKIPEGYSLQNILAVVCEGAAAKKFYFAENGRTLVAEFNSKSLINITPKEGWVFAVTVIFRFGGQTFALEGCDVVNVFELDFRQGYYKLLENYTSLNDKYQLLSESFNKLQSDYDQLESDFNKLKSEHDQLKSDFEKLKSERDDLCAALDEANRDYEALLDEYEKLKPWQYIAYTFIALTILFIATNIYFLVRKAKRTQ